VSVEKESPTENPWNEINGANVIPQGDGVEGKAKMLTCLKDLEVTGRSNCFYSNRARRIAVGNKN